MKWLKLFSILAFAAGMLFPYQARAQISSAPVLIGQKGTTLPTNCQIGQLFFKTNEAAGSNIYGCTSTNTWTAQAGGGGGGDVSASGTPTADQCAVWVDANTIKGVDCPSLTGTPALGDLSLWSSSSAQQLLTAASSSVGSYLRAAGTGAAPVWSTLTLPDTAVAGTLLYCATTNTCAASAAPILGASGTLGALTFGNATSGTVKIQPVTGALGTTTLTLPAAVGTGRVTQVIASGTAALNPGALTSGTCSSAVDGGTATGVVTTDTINHAFNADLTATTGYSGVGTLVTIYKYPTADHVNFKVCNWTGSSITPTSVTINWSVTR